MGYLIAAQQSPAFFTGVAFGAVLLCAGLAIGLWIGKRAGADAGSHHAETERLVKLVSRMVNWSHGMAKEMSEYRSVVSGVSRLFQGADGAFEEPEREATVGLLSQVVVANEQLQTRLNRAETMLKDQAHEISTYMSEARTDPLTSLPNRRAFDEELNRRMAEWRRHLVPLSVLIADIDHFKRLNDTYGHLAGDEVLAEVSHTLKETMRESDIVARIGGEELAVILPRSKAEEACRAAARARMAIEQAKCDYDGQTLQVTVSIGAAQLGRDENSESVLRRADEALYAAKDAGRNLAYWHDGQRCLPAEAGRVRRLERLSDVAPETAEVGSQQGFIQVCSDLRQRLEEVTP
jgi:diguanylate cyclase